MKFIIDSNNNFLISRKTSQKATVSLGKLDSQNQTQKNVPQIRYAIGHGGLIAYDKQQSNLISSNKNKKRNLSSPLSKTKHEQVLRQRNSDTGQSQNQNQIDRSQISKRYSANNITSSSTLICASTSVNTPKLINNSNNNSKKMTQQSSNNNSNNLNSNRTQSQKLKDFKTSRSVSDPEKNEAETKISNNKNSQNNRIPDKKNLRFITSANPEHFVNHNSIIMNGSHNNIINNQNNNNIRTTPQTTTPQGVVPIPQKYEEVLAKRKKWPLKGWHRRYFVFFKGVLEYGRNKQTVTGGRLHGRIELHSCLMVVKHKKHIISIDSGKTVYHMKAKDERIFKECVLAVRQHIEYARYKKRQAQQIMNQQEKAAVLAQSNKMLQKVQPSPNSLPSQTNNTLKNNQSDATLTDQNNLIQNASPGILITDYTSLNNMNSNKKEADMTTEELFQSSLNNMAKLKNDTNLISRYADHAGLFLEVMSTHKSHSKGPKWTRKSIRNIRGGSSKNQSQEKEKEQLSSSSNLLIHQNNHLRLEAQNSRDRDPDTLSGIFDTFQNQILIENENMENNSSKRHISGVSERLLSNDNTNTQPGSGPKISISHPDLSLNQQHNNNNQISNNSDNDNQKNSNRGSKNDLLERNESKSSLFQKNINNNNQNQHFQNNLQSNSESQIQDPVHSLGLTPTQLADELRNLTHEVQHTLTILDSQMSMLRSQYLEEKIERSELKSNLNQNSSQNQTHSPSGLDFATQQALKQIIDIAQNLQNTNKKSQNNNNNKTSSKRTNFQAKITDGPVDNEQNNLSLVRNRENVNFGSNCSTMHSVHSGYHNTLDRGASMGFGGYFWGLGRFYDFRLYFGKSDSKKKNSIEKHDYY